MPKQPPKRLVQVCAIPASTWILTRGVTQRAPARSATAGGCSGPNRLPCRRSEVAVKMWCSRQCTVSRSSFMQCNHRTIPPVLALAALSWACSESQTPTSQTPTTDQPTMEARADSAASHNAVDGAEFGFTPGWLDGQTVTFHYHKPFFCRTPVADGKPVGSTTECEAGS